VFESILNSALENKRPHGSRAIQRMFSFGKCPTLDWEALPTVGWDLRQPEASLP